uniref:Uncharacterized protein n=1 Tax=mine drainage metagenome TaxID=410659 RepID=E6PTC9_9ZZZZ
MNQDHIDITPFRATLLFSRPAASLATEAPVVKAALRAPPPQRGDGFLIMARAGALGAAMPPEFGPDDPLWVIALDERLSATLPQLATCAPEPVNFLSIDMLHCWTFLHWSTPDSSFAALEYALSSDTMQPADRSRPVLFLTPSLAILSSFACDENFILGLQGAGISAGPNYNPWRLWSDEELEAAAQRQTDKNPGGVTFEDWPESGHHWLEVVHYQRDEETQQGVPPLQCSE